MIKWEYKIVTNTPHNWKELGADGWELVNVELVGTSKWHAFFKRPYISQDTDSITLSDALRING